LLGLLLGELAELLFEELSSPPPPPVAQLDKHKSRHVSEMRRSLKRVKENIWPRKSKNLRQKTDHYCYNHLASLGDLSPNIIFTKEMKSL
jgi:hypothetical protein